MASDTTVGGLLNETSSLVGDAIRGVGLYVLVVGGLGAAGLLAGLVEATDNDFDIGMGFMISPEAGVAAGIFQLVQGIVSIVATYLLLAHFLEIRGRLRDKSTRIWAYVGLMILSVLGLMVGFVLLIVPGIILLVRWSASSGFLIGGREGIVDSLKASWRATKGHSWSIFLAGLILLLGTAVIAGIGGAIGTAIASLQVAAIVGQVISAFFNAVFLAFAIAVYVRIDNGAQETAEVFA